MNSMSDNGCYRTLNDPEESAGVDSTLSDLHPTWCDGHILRHTHFEAITQKVSAARIGDSGLECFVDA
ncbi:hypothetical protein ACTXI9_15390, partial [Brachybacterium alimentarium]|uniref:hypothetical protein n=1 Tax=Brachybacterium alimentarium TaxID=47845 RepID=UPI003FD3AAD3